MESNSGLTTTGPNNGSQSSSNITKDFIYQLHPTANSNQAQFVCIGWLDKEEDTLKNEHIELEYEKNPDLDTAVQYKMFRQNLTTGFILTNRRIPLLYLSVLYDKKFVTGHLFNITLYYNISSDLSKITNMDELLKSKLEGSFYFQIDHISLDTKHVILTKYTNLANIREQLINLANKDYILELTRKVLEERDLERVSKYGRITDYVIPVPSVNITKIIQDNDDF
jgi:hypothetical protein